MAQSFGLTILPLHRNEGRAQKGLPGVFAVTPPRRAARSRKNDRLIIYLQGESELRLTRDQYRELLEGAAKTFYNSSGSATSAMTTVVEALNETILKTNLRGGQQMIALLNLVVVRDDHFYLAQCGASHGFYFYDRKLDHYYDAQIAGRGLGVGRSPSIKFFQGTLTDGALLVLLPKVPATWNETTLTAAVGQPLSVAARRFFSDGGEQIRALVLAAQADGEELKLLPANAGVQASGQTPQPQQQAKPAAPPAAQHTPATPPAQQSDAGAPQTQPPLAQAAPPREQPRSAQAQRPSLRDRVRPQAAEQDPTPPPGVEDSPRPAGPRLGERVAPALQRAGSGLRQGVTRSARFLRSMLGRILPSEDMLAIPGWVMAFIAIVVPVVVVMIALVIYTNIGREQQYTYYFLQAQNAAAQAVSLGEDPAAREWWQETIVQLDYAEQYLVTDESQALREQAQSLLDEIDGVMRVQFEPALEAILSQSINIHEMAATATDLYMLDAYSGSVLRAWLTNTGLVMDPDFKCGPGAIGSIIVGELVDIAALSKTNEEEAAVLAMDSNGNLLYCIPGEGPVAVQLEPPDSAWGSPAAMAVDDDRLYILDPQTNAVWVYEGDNELFGGKPSLYFATKVPQLPDAIDLSVYLNDLFILHLDGHVTKCVFNALEAAPTTCDETATFTDQRAGYESGTIIQGARFYQITRTLPPEPSVFFLDPLAQAVYHFSLKLHLSRQYRAATPLPDAPVTAFTVSPTRQIFIAQANQVFVAPIP